MTIKEDMNRLTFYRTEANDDVSLPYAEGGVKAGFPSPAQDYIDDAIDLNRVLIGHPESTFVVRVDGTSMIDSNVMDGDLLLVDKSVEAQEGSMCVCVLNGEFTLKYIHKRNGRLWLVPDNEEFEAIEVGEEEQFEVWGVVSYVIHKAMRKRGGWGNI